MARGIGDELEAPAEAAIFAVIYPLSGDFLSLVTMDAREPLLLDWRRFGESIASYAGARVAADFSSGEAGEFELFTSGHGWQHDRVDRRYEADGVFFLR